ncbi:hypothetical protein BGX33_001004 [Mortierella sp. NVP41]|nr:hypothetical protein BGX33_001004 [Mortierella sp. NVP41]
MRNDMGNSRNNDNSFPGRRNPSSTSKPSPNPSSNPSPCNINTSGCSRILHNIRPHTKKDFTLRICSYPRYAEPGRPEQQQQRQYEQFEQQSRHYREANPSTVNPQDQSQPQRADAYGRSYRHSTYQGVYAGPPQPRPPPTPRQQQIQQLQAQQSLNLSQLGLNRFSVASRDQLPTAPSPSVFSATQPEPKYPEAGVSSNKPAEETNGTSLRPSISTDSLALSEAGIATGSPQDPYATRRGNRSSIYSVYSMGSPVTAERIPRPMSAVVESSPRFPVSPNSIHSAIGNSHNPLARTGSEPHWSSAVPGGGNSVLLQTKARAAQSNASYSHQITLSSIPGNEEVPPMPGKMTSKTGKVRIQLTFDRPFFNAGGELSGRLEIQCSSSRFVMLADMIVELLGYEALAKDHLTPKIFHKTVLRLQDIRHPSQAVQENIEPDADGYWMARKGRTVFPFRLNIQDSLPNSYDSKLGQVRYIVSAIALMKANHNKEVVNHTRECFIYETWTTDDITQARRRSVKADISKRLFMGGEGSLELYAELTRTMVSSGGIVYVNVGVKNLTKKKIMGIKLSLWRHIAVSHSRSSFSSHSSSQSSRDQDNVKNYSEIIYKGEDFAFDSDDPRVVVLPVYIPSGVYSLRHTSCLHVQFFVQVSLMASMSKALAVELPIYITHASSWSDPPPRIPRDFTFPMHEDDPVKKKKTGVFAKMKPSSIVTQQSCSASSSSPKKSSGLTGSSSNLSGVASAPSSKPGTPNTSDAATIDGDSSRSTTRRSTMKDPDSPTSVLDFSQAGNLFVVNPDAASISVSSDSGSAVRMFAAARPAPNPRVLQSGPSSPDQLASPLDRSTQPMMLVGQLSLKTAGETETVHPTVVDEGEDFDMSRAVSASQATSQASLTKRNSDKSNKSAKMGLRKTLAKLSIVIPTHGSSNHHSGSKSAKVSPRVLPSTPRSSKSLNMTSSEEMGSPGARSDHGSRSLSRQSSSSSMGSFTHSFERQSRKSSTGSTRVVNISPGSGSAGAGSPPLFKMTSSSAGSAPPSNVNSAVPSRSSSPALPSASSSATDNPDEPNMRERQHEIHQLSMTPAIPDMRLHRGTPLMNEMGREDYFEPNNENQQESRPTTLSPSENQVMTVQSSPTTPNSSNRPWDIPSNFSSSSLASSSPSEGGQSAQEIRDEYYYGRNSISRNISAESLDTRIASPQVGVPAERVDPVQYSTSSEVYEDSAVPMQALTHELHADREMYGSVDQRQGSTSKVVGDRYDLEHHIAQDVSISQQQHQQEQLQHLEYQQQQQLQQLQEQRHRQRPQLEQQQHQQQQVWGNERYEETPTAPAVMQPPADQILTQHPGSEGYSSIPPSAQHSPVRLNEAPVGLVLPLVQSPDVYYSGDEYVRPLQTRTLSSHSSRPHSRSSSSHSVIGQALVDPSEASTPRSVLSFQQMESLSRSSSPLVRDPIPRNTSMESVLSYSRPDPSALSHTYQQQQRQSMVQEQPTLLRDGQYTPETYSTPMILQDNPVMENSNNINFGHSKYPLLTVNGTSRPTPPLSTSTSFQSDDLRLTPNDMTSSMQLDHDPRGASEGVLREQRFRPQTASATGYSGAPEYRESKYNTALQSDFYSPHPSRSNSRQASPKPWHAEALLPAQPAIVIPPQQQQLQDVPVQAIAQQVAVPQQVVVEPMGVIKQMVAPIMNEQEGEHLIVVDASQPPGVACQAVVDYQASEIPPTTPALSDEQQARFESHPLRHSVYKDETRQAPYQPRTQYVPASTTASATASASGSPLNLDSNTMSTAVAIGDSAMYDSHQYTQPVPVGLTKVVSPPPVPGRPWNNAPPPLLALFNSTPISVLGLDSAQVSLAGGTSFQQQQNAYVSQTEQMSSSQPDPDDAAAIAMVLRVHQEETLGRQESLDQQEAMSRQEILARQEAVARQEALAQQEALAYQQRQQEQQLQQQQQQQFQHEQQQLLLQQQQYQDASRLSGAGDAPTSTGMTLEMPMGVPSIVSPPPVYEPALQDMGGLQTPGFVRGLSDQGLIGTYRVSPRGLGYPEQDVAVVVPGGSSMVVGPESVADLADAIRSIQSSPAGSGGSGVISASRDYPYHQQPFYQQQQQQLLGLVTVPPRAAGDDDRSIADRTSRRPSPLLSGSGDKEVYDEGMWMFAGAGRGGLSVINPDQ